MTQRTALLATTTRPMPRAITRVRAAAEPPPGALAEIMAAFTDFRARNDARLDALQAAVDGDTIRAAGLRLAGGAGDGGPPVDPAYTDVFAGFVRSGDGEGTLRQQNATGDRGAIKAAMSEGTDSAGGYLAPVEWDRKVAQQLRIISPMRRLATVIQTSVRGYSTVWSNGQWGSGWVGETAARPLTTTPSLSTLPFKAGQIYAQPAITQDLLDDADFNIGAWMETELAQIFAVNESIAFVAGDGVNKPQGLLTYVPGGAADGLHPGGNLALVPSGDAAKLTPDGLVSFVFSLPSPYRQGATWLMNSVTAATIALMKDGQGNYLWNKAIALNVPDTLLGYPVEIDENMPSIAAGATPIAFGNFKRGYIINDRAGLSILRDPYTNKPYVQFYSRKRVGAGVWDPNAIRLLKISAS